MRILTVCGSLQAPSGNLALLRAVSRNAPSGVEVVPFDRLGDLPFFNPDLDTGDGPPAVDEWRRAVAGANALLIASPEYGHSLPGVVKNGIDWLIGSAELYRKVIAITAAVVHPDRGRMGLSALAQTLAAVDAVIVWNEPTVVGPNFDDTVANMLRRLIETAAVPTSS
jgi:NAD(P)H-dependent FMN reductase